MSVLNKLTTIGRKPCNIHLLPGDSIVLSYKMDGEPAKVVCTETFTTTCVITECVVVKGEYEDRPAIGGLFLGAK